MKIKSEIKDNRRMVKVKLSYREKINERELNKLSGISASGFLRLQSVKKNTIEYKGSIGDSLTERFKKAVNKEDFFFIMEQIVVMAQTLEQKELSLDYLVLNMEYVFINENTKEIQFLYIPIERKETQVTIMEFMEQIICCIQLDSSENTNYASDFAFFLKGLQDFDEEKIEKYISKKEKRVVEKIRGSVICNGRKTNRKQRYEPDDKDTTRLEGEEYPETEKFEDEEYPETEKFEDEEYLETEKFEDEEYSETEKFEDEEYPETEKFEDEEYPETGLL